MSQHLVPGTVVYIKSMRLQAKLQPLYHGPYTVVSRDEHDNFNFKNSFNQVLSKEYPLCLLKVVMTTDETLVVFEKIKEHKSNRRGQLEYLVKYVEIPLDEASWVKESQISSTDLIEEYWLTQKNEDVLFLTQFTSSKTSGSSFHYPFIWFICFLFLMFFPMVSKQRLTCPFKLCDTTD
jgi:hypothetical protein